jgi:hypothetical protein
MGRNKSIEESSAALAAIVDSLPPVDVGQFAELEAKGAGAHPAGFWLEVGEHIARGSPLRDAVLLCEVHRGSVESVKDAKKWYSRVLQGEDPASITPWVSACGFTIHRAYALQRLRWSRLAELGGRGSAAALWMLERRGGDQYAPPVRKTERKTESKRITAIITDPQNLPVETQIRATCDALGVSDEQLALAGAHWARLMTSTGAS